MSLSVTSESDDGGLSTDSHPSNDCNNFKGRLNGEVVLKKGPWTSTEDAVLVEYVTKHGEGNWNAVQKHSGLSRCGKSCRLRWTNHLRPNLKKGSFTLEEERLIIELHAKMGNKWSRMAAHLPGRTDNEIKNYWNTRIKRRHRAGLPLYPSELCPQALPHDQQTLNSRGTYAGDKRCYDIMQSDGNYKIPEVVFGGLNSLPYTAEFPDISASGSLISGFGCPQFYSFVPQTIGSQKHTQVPHEAMSEYGGGAANEAPSFDNAYTDNFEINRSQPFDLGFQYDPDHTEKQLHLAVKQDCHFMSNGFFSASKPFLGAEKFELPSLQYQDTSFGIWDTAPEFMDSFVQSSLPSPRSSGLLEALLYEAKADNQCSDKATSSAISAVGIKDSSPVKTYFSGCNNGYLDPGSPSSNSIGTFFNECTPTHTVGISSEEKIPVCLAKSEAVVDQRWILDRETKDIFNQSECYSPDAILGSTNSLTCCTWIKMPSVSQMSDRP